MANYISKAFGLLENSFEWSVGMKFTSALSEASAESAWHSSFKAMWDDLSFNALLPATLHFTGTSTSTADANWHQTTKTQTLEDLVGAGGQALPYECAMVFTWRTVLATKAGHGRWYFPSLTTAALATNGWHFSSGTITTAVAAAEVMTGGWAGSLTPVLRHAATNTTTNITHGDIPDGVYSQRRRADKRVAARTTVTI